MLNKSIIALAVTLMLVVASVATLSRYSAIEIARWLLPPDWTLDQLSELSFDWRYGGLRSPLPPQCRRQLSQRKPDSSWTISGSHRGGQPLRHRL